MGHLSVGVYARISAARPVHAHGRARDLAQGGLKRALDSGRRVDFFLNLPAAVACAHIGQKQSEAHYSGSLMRVMSSVSLAVCLGFI